MDCNPSIASATVRCNKESDDGDRRTQPSSGMFAACFIAFAVFFAGRRAAAEDTLFHSERITPQGEYTPGIEGPAVDASGNLYVVNFQRAATSARWRPAPRSRSSSRRFLPAASGTAFVSIGRGGCTSPISRSTLSGSSVWRNHAARLLSFRSIPPAKRPRDRSRRHALCQRPAICIARGRPDLAHYARRRRQGPG